MTLEQREPSPPPPGGVAVGADAADGSANPTEKPIPVSLRTQWLVPLFLLSGIAIFLFAMRTVHGREIEQIAAHPETARAMYAVTYWMENGYLVTGGLMVRSWLDSPPFIYRSSTGAHLLSSFLAQRVHFALRGRTSWKLLVLHNQVFMMILSAAMALLAFRFAMRCGATGLHSLALALSAQVVIFTFPDNLARYWELTGREYFLLFAAIFLLLEDGQLEVRSNMLTLAQVVSAFLLVHAELMSGFFFLLSFSAVRLLMSGRMATLKHLGLICGLPLILALSLFATQISVARALSSLPIYGSEFLFRTGLDGDSTWYQGHLDIALGRDTARLNFPANRESLFHWPWFFAAGAIAFAGILVAGIRRRVADSIVTALVSLVATYLLHGAVFSQSVVVHPYLYDSLLFAPLALALTAVAPALLEHLTGRAGIVTITIVFLSIWISMSQLRNYALRYPLPKPTARLNLVPHDELQLRKMDVEHWL